MDQLKGSPVERLHSLSLMAPLGSTSDVALNMP